MSSALQRASWGLVLTVILGCCDDHHPWMKLVLTAALAWLFVRDAYRASA